MTEPSQAIGEECRQSQELERLRIREVLAVTYLPDGIDLWMGSPNRHLGGATPEDLITCGRGKEVLAVAKRIDGQ